MIPWRIITHGLRCIAHLAVSFSHLAVDLYVRCALALRFLCVFRQGAHS